MILILIALTIYAVIIRTNETSKEYIEEDYTVQKGDTLYGIAQEYADEHTSLNEYIYKVKQVNNITSSNIEVGQTIKILK